MSLPEARIYSSHTPAVGRRVVGFVFDHPDQGRHGDGKSITTSPVVAVDDVVVTTKSGSRYRVLPMDAIIQEHDPYADMSVMQAEAKDHLDALD